MARKRKLKYRTREQTKALFTEPHDTEQVYHRHKRFGKLLNKPLAPWQQAKVTVVNPDGSKTTMTAMKYKTSRRKGVKHVSAG